ncbi:MAG: hypothetical protein RDU14_12435 [Melioribacteraceae bacterium]|nr:hypothetical protein [Melioribacteraceae bacterium]
MSVLLFSKIIVFVSIIVWLIPPIRQFRTSYFYFFLVLALMDPIALIYNSLTDLRIPFGFYLFANFLLLIFLLDFESIKKNLYFIVLSGLVLFGVTTFGNFSNEQSLIILVAIQFFILAVILKKFIINFAFEKKINFFHLILAFYFLTNITKFFNVLTGFADATAFFIITSIAQIIFGLFFSIVREDKPKIVL